MKIFSTASATEPASSTVTNPEKGIVHPNPEHLFSFLQPKAWASLEAAAAVQKEARRSPSPRMLHALESAPALLDAYTTLVLKSCDESVFTPLAALVIQSVNALFPNQAFQAKVRRRTIDAGCWTLF